VSKLELKIPPVLLTILFASMMWLLALATPEVHVLKGVTIVVSAIAIVTGGLFALAGVIAFRNARTTVNPTTPEASSALVTSGVYRYTRNPMYLGLLLLLIGWGLFLANAFALTLTFAFVGYMNRFQIEPEERALEVLFGADFATYSTQVRRWI
jgi:protein-S-isoprenylcysteine O-methyltransferase Ste14